MTSDLEDSPTAPASDLPAPGAQDLPGGPARRRGPLRAGERVQLTDSKGRLHTILLTHDGYFQSHRGSFRHSELIGRDEGTVLTTASGHQLLALRPLLSDYVLSMPRGAAVVYPKDAGQIVQMGDIFPGARVVEAGVGSGALSMSLLSAVGERGSLLSVERREDFADIARGNVESWFGGPHPAWDVRVGDLADALATLEPGSVDRVVLDMLAPWENLDAVSRALAPGGVVIAYVATTTQLSRFAEDARSSESFTEPQAWEAMVRTWHLEGLSVRPDHRMIGHTGFLITARRLAPGSLPPQRTRRPAKGAYPTAEEEWSPEDVGERAISDKKVRRVRRDIHRRAVMEETGMAGGGVAPAGPAPEVRPAGPPGAPED